MNSADPHTSLLLQKALRSARLRRVPSGQILLFAGDLPSEVFILKSGIVKLHDIDDQGNQKILHIVKPFAVLPFAFFSGMKEPLRWFYTALTDCELYVLLATELQEMVRADGRLGETLTNAFSVDVHELLVRLSSLGKTNARDKVIAALEFLLTSHARERRGGWWQVTFPVSQQLIADVCGITRETVVVVMKELQEQKVVRNPEITKLEINKKNLGV